MTVMASKYFRPLEGYRLALARNVGHASASATLAMLDADDSHRSTLVRWEHLLGASIASDQQRWHSQWRNRLETLAGCFFPLCFDPIHQFSVIQ